MSEYIDRDMAIDVVARWFKEINLNGDICIDGLNSLPAVDVAKGVIEYWKKEGFIPSCDMVRTPHYAIHGAPAADVVVRKTGKWCADYDYAEYDFDGSTPLPEPRKFQDGWQCSLCGGYSPRETNYCPNCGAKMDDGSENQNWDMANIHTDDCW